MGKIKSTVYLTECADDWILEQARLRGVSKSDVVQLLINEAMAAAVAAKIEAKSWGKVLK